MQFLWVNNVPSIVGGTLNCTHSMCQALPEHRHSVVSCQGQFGAEERSVFKGVADLVDWTDSRTHNPDVVVYQNSGNAVIGHSKATKSVYYQHSVHSAIGKERCDHVLYVSDYLKRLQGEEGVVLHQPVTIPKNRDFWVRPSGILIGRICTPIASKWRPEDFLPHLAAAASVPNTRFEFVGCPSPLQQQVADAVDGRAVFYPASLAARSLLRWWDIMLYTSSQRESFGRTVREAQRCGCVPIVSNHSGLAEQVREGSGFLVESPQDVKVAIERTVADPGLGMRCEAWGNETGSLSGWAEKFLHILEM